MQPRRSKWRPDLESSPNSAQNMSTPISEVVFKKFLASPTGLAYFFRTAYYWLSRKLRLSTFFSAKSTESQHSKMVHGFVVDEKLSLLHTDKKIFNLTPKYLQILSIIFWPSSSTEISHFALSLTNEAG